MGEERDRGEVGGGRKEVVERRGGRKEVGGERWEERGEGMR